MSDKQQTSCKSELALQEVAVKRAYDLYQARVQHEKESPVTAYVDNLWKQDSAELKAAYEKRSRELSMADLGCDILEVANIPAKIEKAAKRLVKNR